MDNYFEFEEESDQDEDELDWSQYYHWEDVDGNRGNLHFNDI